MLERRFYLTWLVNETVPSCDALCYQDRLDIVQGDLAHASSYDQLTNELDGVYVLGRERWSQREKESDLAVARQLSEFMGRASIKRCIYLSDRLPNSWVTPHMRAKNRVSLVLKASGIPLTILRIGMVVAPGDRVFDGLVRLVERSPVWPKYTGLAQSCRPIDPRDLVSYLVAFLDVEPFQHRSFDVSGLSQISLGDFLMRVAQVMGLKRRFLKFPFGSRWFLRLLAMTNASVEWTSTAAWAERLSFQHGLSGRNARPLLLSRTRTRG